MTLPTHQGNTSLLGVWVFLSLFSSASVLGTSSSVSSLKMPQSTTVTVHLSETTIKTTSRSYHTYHHDPFSIQSASLVANRSRGSFEGAGTTPHGLRRMTRRQAEEVSDIDFACKSFSEGDSEKQEFFSPNYPDDYGNHTDCYKIIEAPTGSLLRLDFRDTFRLEPSENCKNDYLEVRDGAHGFSNEIGRFCGHDFPPMVTSSDRYLWLRFHSDETIQYSGFRAVYSFIPRPTSANPIPDLERCQFNLNGSDGFANRSDIEPERDRLVMDYGLPIDCMWTITVEKGWKIMLQFVKFKLEKPNDCESNFVDIFSDRTDLPSKEKTFCGSIADSVSSKNNILFIRFFVDHRSLNSYFSAYFTAFRERQEKPCTSEEYDCEDGTCIASNMRCNGITNCRYRWDEFECEVKESFFASIIKSEHIVIILVVFCLILFGMCFAFVFNCTKKLIRDHRIIQEHLRQSREGALNAAGTKGSQKIPLPIIRARSHSNDSSVVSVPAEIRKDGSIPVECYVPSGELVSIFDPRRSDEEEPMPEMRDTECQTRESLFATQPIDPSSEHSPTPPPLPAARIPKSPPNFSTFGYPKPDEKKYRAEAVIEMTKQASETRPFSIQSTKSAPDVIVTH